MAKKPRETREDQDRQSRKQVLLARKQEKQTRQLRLAVIGVGILVGIIAIFGVISVLIITPDQPVADVYGTEIALEDWQNQVEFQRAQFVIGIEDLAEVLGQDIGQIQQFAQQQLALLHPNNAEVLGQQVLDQVIDDELVRPGRSSKRDSSK